MKHLSFENILSCDCNKSPFCFFLGILFAGGMLWVVNSTVSGNFTEACTSFKNLCLNKIIKAVMVVLRWVSYCGLPKNSKFLYL